MRYRVGMGDVTTGEESDEVAEEEQSGGRLFVCPRGRTPENFV